jgi:2-dehydro-3-deoxyphosphooctonate aldolase (KDO 8-P synthase)
VNSFRVGDAEIGGSRLFVIAGPCVVESEDMCLRVAESLKRACVARGAPFIFKASSR